jgi:hypothetical protein
MHKMVTGQSRDKRSVGRAAYSGFIEDKLGLRFFKGIKRSPDVGLPDVFFPMIIIVMLSECKQPCPHPCP